ncbi:MAG: quinolinate synthase NadA [Candidatus Izemoplasma sp.]
MNKLEMYKEINQLKKEKNAVILAHYYQDGDVQDIADFTGDSLYLSQVAAETDADIIIFAGVHFMAETAKILSPSKKVLLPVKEAGCPMADMVTKAKLKQYKRENPDRTIICYVNSTAEVKALSDVCVTSSNAEKVISHYKDKKLMYVPDKNLGLYVKRKFNLDMEVWPGFCCIHNSLTVKQVDEKRLEFPNAEFIVHPEAPLDVVDVASYVGSTKGLLEYVINSDHDEFIIGTEKGIIHQMELACPNKKFHILTLDLSCYDMKMTQLEDVYLAIKEERFEITVDESIRKDAFKALDKMLKLS